ncbi:18603_t:CDS:2, partial [Gigaspora rosea]
EFVSAANGCDFIMLSVFGGCCVGGHVLTVIDDCCVGDHDFVVVHSIVSSTVG